MLRSESSPYILFVGNGWFPSMPGGLNRYIYEFIHQLASSHIWTELLGVGLPSASSDSFIKFTNLANSDSSIWQKLWGIRKNYLMKQPTLPDVINLHFSLYSLPLLSVLPTNVPITFTFHGPWSLESQREGDNRVKVLAKKWIETQVFRRSDRFITLSKSFGDILSQRYCISPEKIHVIPGGVDTLRFQPTHSRQEARDFLKWPQDRMILFTPRRLVHRMGLSQLLSALAFLNTTISDVWLAIAGKGVLRETLEQQVNDLGLHHQVKFLGFLPDAELPIAYQAADLTIVPSHSLEGFGLVLLESLACGTPVMCTPVGGMPEILEPFSPELITNGTGVEAIAAHLKSLILGQISIPSRDNCRQYAASNFDWSQISKRILKVLFI